MQRDRSRKELTQYVKMARHSKILDENVNKMFRNYVHDVTLLIMQIYDDDDDLATLLLFNYYIRKL